MYINIGQRILFAFSLVVLLTIGFAVYQISNVGQMRELVQEVVDHDFGTLRLLRQIDISEGQMRVRQERTWLLYFLGKANLSDDGWVAAEQKWEIAHQHTEELIASLIKMATSHAQTTQSKQRADLYRKIAETSKAREQIISDTAGSVHKLFETMKSGDMLRAKALFDVLDDLRDKLSANSDDVQVFASDLPGLSKDSIDTLYQSAVKTSIVALLIVVVLGLGATWLLHRSINKPLSGLMPFVEQIGRGDLSRKTEHTSRDEFGKLGHTLNTMVDNLADMARQAQTATGQLNSATAELQASAKQHAASTSEQSAAIQQITSTLNEITQSGTQIAERAKTVAAAAEATTSVGRSGSEAIAETARAITSIGEQAEAVAVNIVALTEKTQSIGEIIASVNDIAERSDLLALNAAIEAAAAGDNGRSFAVVAEEMKSLADQAKDATRQVGNLLGEIQKGISVSVMQTEEAVKRAENGRAQVDRTERTIVSLIEGIEESVATFQQIMAASNQQQIGIEQVSQSVQSIREASQQMTAGIRGLEQSAVNLSTLGTQLQQSVDRYVV